MIIKLSPIRMDKDLDVSVESDILTINELELDLSVIPEGATLPADAVDCEFVIGEISRTDGILHITLLLPLTEDASESAKFPTPIETEDGKVELPK